MATNWQLDDYGRKKIETRPDGTVTTATYTSCNTPPCWGVPDLRFYVDSIDTGSDSSLINERHFFYDGFNRLRDEESYRSNGYGQPTVWNIDAVHLYDSLGRQTQLTRPYSTSGSNGYQQWTYDVKNRPTQARLYQSSGTLDRTTYTQYLGRTIQTTDPRSNTVSRVSDVVGYLRKVIDPSPGGTTQYAYDAFGNANKIIDAIGASSSATYNLRGFRTQSVDPDAGTWNIQGDSLNETVSWQDAKTQSFSATYDLLGRLKTRTEPEGTSTWTWGTAATQYNIGKLASVTGYGYTENLTYNSLGQTTGRQIISDQTYQYSYTFNSQGLLSTITYPASPVPSGQTGTALEIEYAYSVGEPVQIQDITNSTPVTLWTSVSSTDSRRLSSETLGSSSATVTINSGFKAWTDEVLSIKAGSGGSTTNIQNLGFLWDTSGNLTQRGDANQTGTCTVNGSGSKLCEAFTPDALNRLSASTLNGVTNLTLAYDAAGDITSKSDVGTYTYPAPTASHPHFATAAGSNSFTADANGNVATKDGLTQTLASYNLPTTLRGAPSGTSYADFFYYGPDHQRIKEIASYLGGTETTQFVGVTLEKMTDSANGITYWRHYVVAPSGRHILVSRNSDLSTSKYFLLGDHLNSEEAIVDGTTGTFLTLESFDAFGQRRNGNWTPGVPSNWYQVGQNNRHGFTFHEQLDGVGFVHMNGRVYDPTVGRFLSVDPIMGGRSDSQRINPYNYVRNRPVVLKDPTGLDDADFDPITVVSTSGADFSITGVFGGLGLAGGTSVGTFGIAEGGAANSSSEPSSLTSAETNVSGVGSAGADASDTESEPEIVVTGHTSTRPEAPRIDIFNTAEIYALLAKQLNAKFSGIAVAANEVRTDVTTYPAEDDSQIDGYEVTARRSSPGKGDEFNFAGLGQDPLFRFRGRVADYAAKATTYSFLLEVAPIADAGAAIVTAGTKAVSQRVVLRVILNRLPQVLAPGQEVEAAETAPEIVKIYQELSEALETASDAVEDGELSELGVLGP